MHLVCGVSNSLKSVRKRCVYELRWEFCKPIYRCIFIHKQTHEINAIDLIYDLNPNSKNVS